MSDVEAAKIPKTLKWVHLAGQDMLRVSTEVIADCAIVDAGRLLP